MLSTTRRWERWPGLTLRQIRLNDRLREMEFEFPPVETRERIRHPPRRRRRTSGDAHLPADDRLASYSSRLSGAALVLVAARHLSGSADAALVDPGRVGAPLHAGRRLHDQLVGDRETL